jgi:hypothetical protein
MEYIIEPGSFKKYSIYSDKGKSLLKKYILYVQTGGNYLNTGSPTCDVVDDRTFGDILKGMKSGPQTSWVKYIIYVLENFGFVNFVELFGIKNSWIGQYNDINCPWLVYDRFFSEFITPNNLMADFLKKKSDAMKWFERISSIIANMAILNVNTGSLDNPIYNVVQCFRYEGVINGYLPLSGYIDDETIRTKILNTNTSSVLLNYTKGQPVLWTQEYKTLINASYKKCFGRDKNINETTEYHYTFIGNYPKIMIMHFCSLGPSPIQDYTFPFIYDVCKITSAVSIKGGCKLLIKNVLKYCIEQNHHHLGLLVRINTNVKIPKDINYAAIRCYLQCGFRFVKLDGTIIDDNFSCDGDFKDYKNELRTYILENKSEHFKGNMSVDGFNAIMINDISSQKNNVPMNTKVEISVVTSNLTDNPWIPNTQIQIYDDLYGINPLVPYDAHLKNKIKTYINEKIIGSLSQNKQIYTHIPEYKSYFGTQISRIHHPETTPIPIDARFILRAMKDYATKYNNNINLEQFINLNNPKYNDQLTIIINHLDTILKTDIKRIQSMFTEDIKRIQSMFTEEHINFFNIVRRSNFLPNTEENIAALFNNDVGIPFILWINWKLGGGHVVWAINVGKLPILICRQRYNKGECPIVYGYSKIKEYLFYAETIGKEISPWDLDAPIKFGNINVEDKTHLDIDYPLLSLGLLRNMSGEGGGGGGGSKEEAAAAAEKAAAEKAAAEKAAAEKAAAEKAAAIKAHRRKLLLRSSKTTQHRRKRPGSPPASASSESSSPPPAAAAEPSAIATAAKAAKAAAQAAAAAAGQAAAAQPGTSGEGGGGGSKEAAKDFAYDGLSSPDSDEL